jgi:hypothetical protein
MASSCKKNPKTRMASSLLQASPFIERFTSLQGRKFGAAHPYSLIKAQARPLIHDLLSHL